MVVRSVISIQSQVAHGHVGNSAAVLPLQLHGFRVAAVPTILLSNHPAYPSVHGRALDPALVADILVGVEERGLVQSSSAILTGYMGSAETAEVVAAFLERARQANPDLTIVCDPVVGDIGKGFYVKPEVREAMARRLVPLADVITPNRFELGFLCGDEALAAADPVAAARALGKRVVLVTGGGAAGADGQLTTMAVTQDAAFAVDTPDLACKASGTGDLLASLFLACLLKSQDTAEALSYSVSSVFAVIEATVAEGLLELALIETASELTALSRIFPARRI